jgi:hypothetical protein
MTRRRHHTPVHAFAAFLLMVSAAAQDDATTLHDLADRADWIAVVEVRGPASDDGRDHAVGLRALRSLRGEGPASFELREPCGHTCGRALHGLEAGTRLLAFLRRNEGGVRLATSSARGLPLAEPQLVAHVEALLRAGEAERIELLTAALASADARVRRDAAAVLPHLRGLERANAGQRARIAAALGGALASADPGCVGLARTAQRLRLVEAIDPLLGAYLGDGQPGLAPLLLDVLPRIDPARTAEHLAANLPSARGPRLRAAELLARLDTPAARTPLLQLARGDERDVAIRAAAGLLAAGVDAAALARETSADLVQAAQRRVAAERPRFRSVLKGGSR